MRFGFAIILLCLAIFGCKNAAQKKPEYLINEDKMVHIMVDMHLVESASNLKILEPDSGNSKYFEHYASIFTTYGIEKWQFDSSLFYYSTKTKQMDSIYNRVLENLYELESQVNSDQ